MLINSDCGAVLIVTENYRGSNDVPVGVHTLVVLGDEDNLPVTFLLGGGFDKVYMRGNAVPVSGIGSAEVTYSDSFETCGVKFEYDGSALIASTEGITFAVVIEEQGAVYGGNMRGTDFNLYCYGSDGAVLYAENSSFGLSVCGSMRYELSDGTIIPSYVIPKE